jgi:hypothetical protein
VAALGDHHRIDDQRCVGRVLPESGGNRFDHLGAVQHARLQRVGTDVGQHHLDLLGDEGGFHRHHAMHALGVLGVSAVIAVAAKPAMAVTALISAWIPAPPPESEPATIRTRPFMPPAGESPR